MIRHGIIPWHSLCWSDSAGKGRESLRFEAITDHLYKLVKLITETEMGTFTTQFVNCKKGIEARSQL